jgi:hypothetical protein
MLDSRSLGEKSAAVDCRDAIACSVMAVTLEREKGADHRKNDRSHNDLAGAPSNRGRDRGEPCREQHSQKPTENGEPPKNRNKHQPAADAC